MTEPTHPLADAITDGLNAHADHMRVGHETHRKNEKLDFMEHLEGEGVEAIQQILGAHLQTPDLPVEIRQLLERVTNPTHQAELGAVAGILIGIGYTLTQAVLAGPTTSIAQGSMRQYGRYTIDANQVAQAMISGRIAPGEGVDRLGDSGITGTQVQQLIDINHGTLSPTQWTELLNRHRIVKDVWTRRLAQNYLDDDSIVGMDVLRHGPPDFGTIVAAVTQSQLTMDEFRDLLGQNGFDPSYAEIIFQTAGQSPPPELAGRLFREGWVDEALYKKMLLESPLKNQYVDVLANLRFRFPPMRTVLKMLSDGLIDETTAKEYLTKLGFFPVDADRLVASAAKHTTTGVKNLSPAAIEQLYEVGKFDRGTAQTHLETLGYDATEADLLLVLVETKRQHASTMKAANAVGTRYVGWKIDRNTASQALDKLAVAPADRDELLTDWDLVRETRTAHLTRADIHKAVNAAKMTHADGIARLRAMGYDAADADLIPVIDKWA